MDKESKSGGRGAWEAELPGCSVTERQRKE
jgi:hypothetical protein